jgi:hypothetical protein
MQNDNNTADIGRKLGRSVTNRNTSKSSCSCSLLFFFAKGISMPKNMKHQRLVDLTASQHSKTHLNGLCQKIIKSFFSPKRVKKILTGAALVTLVSVNLGRGGYR